MPVLIFNRQTHLLSSGYPHQPKLKPYLWHLLHQNRVTNDLDFFFRREKKKRFHSNKHQAASTGSGRGQIRPSAAHTLVDERDESAGEQHTRWWLSDKLTAYHYISRCSLMWLNTPKRSTTGERSKSQRQLFRCFPRRQPYFVHKKKKNGIITTETKMELTSTWENTWLLRTIWAI